MIRNAGARSGVGHGRGTTSTLVMSRPMYLYLLQSDRVPQQRYVGITEDLDKRLAEHNAGASPHTSNWKPWKLLVANYFADKEKASAFERYLRKGSGHAFANRHFW